MTDLVTQARFGSDLLSTTIRMMRNSIESDLMTRKHHPTYGITKTKMRDNLRRLEGLLYAWWLDNTGTRSAAFIAQVRDAANTFGIDLQDLGQRIDLS